MDTPDTATVTVLWRCGLVALGTTLIDGLLLYAIVWFGKFAKASLLRSQLASVACSVVVILSFLVSAFIAIEGCPYVAIFVIIPGVLVGIVLTLPVQTRILGLSGQAGITVWLAYALATPLVVGWTVFCLLWAQLL